MDEGRDLTAYYAAHLRPGMVDLSTSSPEPLPLEYGSLADVPLSSVNPPGGSLALREVIAARYKWLTAEDILVASGASEILVALALAAADSSREVITWPGTYPSLTAAVHAVHAGA